MLNDYLKENYSVYLEDNELGFGANVILQIIKDLEGEKEELREDKQKLKKEKECLEKDYNWVYKEINRLYDERKEAEKEIEELKKQTGTIEIEIQISEKPHIE